MEQDKKVSEKIILRDKMPKREEIAVVTDSIHPLAVYDHKCKKCGYEKAMLISKGVWYTDEDEVMEYVCGKCGYHEKASDGSKIT